MNHDLLEKLYAEYFNDALLYTLSLTKNKALAEEIAQQAFVKALKTADDAIVNFKPWLLKVCRNIFYSHTRKMKKQVKIHEGMEDGEESLIEKIIKEEEYQALYRAIELLPDTQREIILLFYFENLPIKIISAIISKTETHIKVLLYRARENLKNILEA